MKYHPFRCPFNTEHFVVLVFEYKNVTQDVERKYIAIFKNFHTKEIHQKIIKSALVKAFK